MQIKLKTLKRPIKMGIKRYRYCLYFKNNLFSEENYSDFVNKIKKECLNEYYFSYNKSVLFENMCDAEYFAMQAAFIIT